MSNSGTLKLAIGEGVEEMVHGSEEVRTGVLEMIVDIRLPVLEAEVKSMSGLRFFISNFEILNLLSLVEFSKNQLKLASFDFVA